MHIPCKGVPQYVMTPFPKSVNLHNELRFGAVPVAVSVALPVPVPVPVPVAVPVAVPVPVALAVPVLVPVAVPVALNRRPDGYPVSKWIW